MPLKLKDLAVKTGSYTDRNGETKNRYKNIGSILQLDDGSKIILLDRSFNPAGVPHKEGSDQIIVSAFDPRPRGGESEPLPAAPNAPPRSRPAPQPAAAGFDDDIPF